MPLHPSVAESVLSPPVLFSESLMISSSLACFPRATVHALPSLTRPSLSLSFSLTVTKRQSCFTCRGTKESLVTVSPSAQSLGEREGGLCSFLPFCPLLSVCLCESREKRFPSDQRSGQRQCITREEEREREKACATSATSDHFDQLGYACLLRLSFSPSQSLLRSCLLLV